MGMNITFVKAALSDKETICSWLAEPHMMEFWDNSGEHKDDILNFMNGRREVSNYFDGIFDYWIGLMDGVPYAIIMTHVENETISPDHFKPYLARGGKTFSMDFGIGNKDFVGKGLAALTLEEFIKYFAKHIEPEAKQFLIDPDMNNPRAIHVYQKAGFEIVSEFIVKNGFFEGNKGILLARTVD